MAQRFRSIGESFGERAADYRRHAILHQRILERLVSFAGDHLCDGTRWLDIGCGPGLLSRVLSSQTTTALVSVVGVDLSHATVRLALRAERYDGAVVGDALRLPLKDAVADIAVFSAVAQWLSEPTPALSEIRRVLLPHGRALLSFFVKESFAELKALQQEFDIATPAQYYTPDECRRFIESAGFYIRRAEIMGEQLFFRTVRRALAHFALIGAAVTTSPSLDATRLNLLCREYHRRFCTKRGIPVTYRAFIAEASALPTPQHCC